VREYQQQLAFSAQEAAQLSAMRYRGGAASSLEVLTNETNYCRADLGLAPAQSNELALSFAFTETSVEAGNNRMRRRLDWLWLETRHDKNDDLSEADSSSAARQNAARLSLSGTNRGHSSTTDFSGSMRNAHISAPVSRTPAEMKNGVIHIPL
jgi:hypothetical protein